MTIENTNHIFSFTYHKNKLSEYLVDKYSRGQSIYIYDKKNASKRTDLSIGCFVTWVIPEKTKFSTNFNRQIMEGPIYGRICDIKYEDENNTIITKVEVLILANLSLLPSKYYQRGKFTELSLYSCDVLVNDKETEDSITRFYEVKNEKDLPENMNLDDWLKWVKKSNDRKFGITYGCNSNVCAKCKSCIIEKDHCFSTDNNEILYIVDIISKCYRDYGEEEVHFRPLILKIGTHIENNEKGRYIKINKKLIRLLVDHEHFKTNEIEWKDLNLISESSIKLCDLDEIDDWDYVSCKIAHKKESIKDHMKRIIEEYLNKYRAKITNLMTKLVKSKEYIEYRGYGRNIYTAFQSVYSDSKNPYSGYRQHNKDSIVFEWYKITQKYKLRKIFPGLKLQKYLYEQFKRINPGL